jgi:hypothetical protein
LVRKRIIKYILVQNIDLDSIWFGCWTTKRLTEP